VSGKPTRVLSDAQIAAILKRREQDERGEVPAPETLTDFDGLLKLGLIDPDLHFLIRRVGGCKDPDKLKDAVRCALVELLCEHRQCPGIPLSPQVLDLIADELERGSDPEAEKRRSRLTKAEWMRADLEATEAMHRQRGVPHPRGKAKGEVASRFGHNSGKALNKALQPNRVNRKPRRTPRG
jgi:hypothetical protein